MDRSKNTLTLSLMTGSIILVLTLQGFWLKSAYKETRQRFGKETGFLFRTTVTGLQDSLLRENIQAVPPDSLFSPSLFPADGPSADSSMGFPRSFLNSVPHPGHIAVMITTDSLNRDTAFHKSRPARYFVLHEADSLRIRDIEKEYRVALAEAGIHIPFTVLKLQPDSAVKGAGGRFAVAKRKFGLDRPPGYYMGFSQRHQPDTGKEDRLSSALPAIAAISEEEGFPGFHEESWLSSSPRDEWILESGQLFLPQTGLLSVAFDKAAYRWFLLRELSPQLLFSLVMVLFIGISFYFMYRSLHMQRRLMLLKNDFVSNMTHELKTPVATASVAIEALQSFQTLKDPERTHEYLEIARHELKRLTLLTENILKAAVFENKSIALRVESIELKEIVCQVLDSMKLVFGKKQAEVSFHPEGENFRVRGERAHIVNLFYNLLDNALKYSPGKPRIEVRLKSLKEGILLNVIDNGTGIPVEFQQKVFEKFFRVPNGDVHNIKGYGLGLSYVAGVVKSHGGTIRLDSQVGKGSRFIVYLPRYYEKSKNTLHRR